MAASIVQTLSFLFALFLMPQLAYAAVAFDSVSESHTGTTGATATYSWTHTPSGTPRGVLVFVFDRGGSEWPYGDVTYGGVVMKAIPGSDAQDVTATEGGTVRAYFLGRDIPSGAQTVEVNESGTMANNYAVAISVTGTTDTAYGGVIVEQNNQALTEENVDDGSLGTNSVRFAAILHGGANDGPAGSNSTSLADIDFGSFNNSVYRETTAGQGSQPVGVTNATADDVAAVYLALTDSFPDTTQTNFRFFEGNGALPSYDPGTTPVIEAADITHTNNNVITNRTVAYPAYSTGDLIIQSIATDAAVTHTAPATGPDGEALGTIADNASPGAAGPSMSIIYYVATSGQSAGNLTWTFSADETSSGETIVVPAGEFNATNPVNAISSAGIQGSGTGPTVTMPSFDTTFTSDNGRLIVMGGVDADPMSNPFSPGGTWTDRAGAARDDGAQNSFVATRNAAVSFPETVATADFSINTGDTAVVVGFVVNPPLGTANGRTPLEEAGADATLDVDADYGWQFRIKNHGNAEVADDYKLQYFHNEGTATWTDITISSDVVVAALTSDFANGDDALKYIGGVGVFDADNNAALESTGALTLGAGLDVDHGFEGHLNFQIVSGDVDDGDTIQLRVVYGDGTVLETYADTPTITVVEGSGTVPTILTGAAGNISPSGATLFGNIVNDGGSSVVEHGFSTSTSPTMSTDVSTTTLGAGSTGPFSGSVILNSSDTDFYYRAYALNSEGYGFGSVRNLYSGNVSISRSMRLFSGFIIKLFTGKIILFGSQ